MKRKIDLMSILGWVLGVGLIFVGIILTKETDPETQKQIYTITIGSIGNFFDPTSIAIVIGGTFCGLMVAFPGGVLARIPKHMQIIFSPRQYNPMEYIEKLVECAKKARISGLLALEEDISELPDAFMRSSLMMVVDSVDPEKVKQQMESWIDSLEERHVQERSFYDKGAALAPAFGMIGTLIGLINMMKNLESIETVGPNMAVALITTFYGSVLSNLVFIPISNKLRVRHDEEYLCKQIICEGVQAIQAGENPKFIEDRLIHLLPEYKQKKFASAEDGEGGEGAGEAKPKKGKKEK